MDNVFSNVSDIDEEYFRSVDGLSEKIEQFFIDKFLHSKVSKMRWICVMSRNDHDFIQKKFEIMQLISM